MPNALSGKVGALTLPKGPEWYDVSLQLQTTTKMTIEKIANFASRLMARAGRSRS